MPCQRLVYPGLFSSGTDVREEARAADDGQTELVLRFDMALTADTDGFPTALDRANRWVLGKPMDR